MADVNFNQGYPIAEAGRGSWVPIEASTISGGIPSGSRGKYAQLNYIIGSEPGALNLALSGGTVILPVSTVSISEPLAVENTAGQDLVVTQNFPDTTVYETIVVPATGVATINFSPDITLLELFNTNTLKTVYVGFNNVGLSGLSAQALPLFAESFYSIERDTSVVYIGNADTISTVDVRVVGHYKA